LFNCNSTGCKAIAPVGATLSVASGDLKHDESITISCKATHMQTNKGTAVRKCVNGALSPTLTAEPFVCTKKCVVSSPANTVALASLIVIPGATVEFVCKATHTVSKGHVAKRLCVSGVLTPTLAASPFTCNKKCLVDKVHDTTSVPSVGTTINHLQQALYSCVANHKYASGSSTRTCKDGKLEPSFTDDKIVCNEKCVVSSPANTVALASAVVDPGATVEFKCQATHSVIKGHVAKRLCVDGVLTPTLAASPFTCNKRCLITAVPNASPLTGNIYHLVRVEYKCNKDYTMTSGTASRTCKNGILEPSFANDKIVCSKKCKAPAVAGAKLKVAGDAISGTTVEYTCLPHYVQEATSLMVRTCTNGVLTPAATVTPVKCNSPCTAVLPDHSGIITPPPHIHGKTFVMKCVPGYTYKVNANIGRTCNDGKIEPSFVAKPFVCSKDCPVPTDGTHATVVLTGKYHHGSSVSWTCAQGFSTAADQLKKTCNNGVWENTNPVVCYADCLPETLAGGEYLPRKAKGLKHQHSTKVVYTCDKDRTLSSGAVLTRTCTNGVFLPAFATSPLVCHAGCNTQGWISKATFDAPGSLHTHGTQLTLRCVVGYSVDSKHLGHNKRTCQDGKIVPTLTDRGFTCRKDCKRVTSKSHGSFTPTSATVPHGGKYTFQCDQNYSHSGKGKTVEFSCANGVITPSIADTVYCHKDCVPETLTNGKVSKPMAKYNHGVKIAYACNNKYSPTSAKDLERTCTDGVFKPTLAVKAISCLEDCDVTTVNQALSDATTTSVKAGAVVTYKCKQPKHSPVKGVAKARTCISGQLSPVLAGATAFICYPTCEFLNEKGVMTTILHNDAYTWKCDAGFDFEFSVKDGKKTCNKGKLEPASKPWKCHKKCKVDKLTGGQISDQSLRLLKQDVVAVKHKQTVSYSCLPGHSFTSTVKNSRTCNEGVYDKTFVENNMKCNKDCKPPTIKDSLPVTKDYKHGEKIDFTCPASHTKSVPVGAPLQYCNDGSIADTVKNQWSCRKKCTVPSWTNTLVYANNKLINVGVNPQTLYDDQTQLIVKCLDKHSWHPNPSVPISKESSVAVLCSDGVNSVTTVMQCYPGRWQYRAPWR